jgi:membrane protein
LQSGCQKRNSWPEFRYNKGIDMTTEPTSAAAGVAVDRAMARRGDAIEQLRSSMLQTLRRNGVTTLKYLATTEVHTYAFSVAANAILSFMPAAVLMLTVSRSILHSRAMADAVLGMIKAFLPLDQSTQALIAGWVNHQSRGHAIEVFSLIMLFISCTGVFEPLEVALNSVWGFKSRNYLRNQLVSVGLALACGVLAFASVAATAGIWAPTSHAQVWMDGHLGAGIIHALVTFINTTLQQIVLKTFGLSAAILIFFLIYWLLPNGKIAPGAVLPSAIITGLAFEVAQVTFMKVVPWLDFKATYGNFSISVTLIFWAFFVGLLLLGGAHLSAQDVKTSQKMSLMTPVAVADGSEDAKASVEAAKGRV